MADIAIKKKNNVYLTNDYLVINSQELISKLTGNKKNNPLQIKLTSNSELKEIYRKSVELAKKELDRKLKEDDRKYRLMVAAEEEENENGFNRFMNDPNKF